MALMNIILLSDRLNFHAEHLCWCEQAFKVAYSLLRTTENK